MYKIPNSVKFKIKIPQDREPSAHNDPYREITLLIVNWFHLFQSETIF